jgi:hypothetical protein
MSLNLNDANQSLSKTMKIFFSISLIILMMVVISTLVLAIIGRTNTNNNSSRIDDYARMYDEVVNKLSGFDCKLEELSVSINKKLHQINDQIQTIDDQLQDHKSEVSRKFNDYDIYHDDQIGIGYDVKNDLNTYSGFKIFDMRQHHYNYSCDESLSIEGDVIIIIDVMYLHAEIKIIASMHSENTTINREVGCFYIRQFANYYGRICQVLIDTSDFENNSLEITFRPKIDSNDDASYCIYNFLSMGKIKSDFRFRNKEEEQRLHDNDGMSDLNKIKIIDETSDSNKVKISDLSKAYIENN